MIENYLDGGMSEQERFGFEEKIAQNKALANKVAEARAVNEAIYYASLAEFKDTISKDLKNIKYNEPANWKKIGTISAISIAIVAFVATYFISTNTFFVSTNKVETKNNDISPERFSIQERESASSEDTTIKVIDSKESQIKKESGDPLHIKDLNKQNPVNADTLLTKSVMEYTNTPLENKTQSNQSESTAKKVETPVLNENKILCDKSFKINTQASCKDKETGSILIVSDGAYAYTYQIDIQSKTGSKGLFPNLSSGVYDLAVTYGKECTYNKKVTIGEKWCAMNEAYSFNPDYNEKWKPIYESGTSGTILIYDKQGKEIYNLPFGSGNEEWIGNDKQGMAAAVGVYVAIINYSDGRKEKVELTIVR